jgi:hypothetical protein
MKLESTHWAILGSALVVSGSFWASGWRSVDELVG